MERNLPSDGFKMLCSSHNSETRPSRHGGLLSTDQSHHQSIHTCSTDFRRSLRLQKLTSDLVCRRSVIRNNYKQNIIKVMRNMFGPKKQEISWWSYILACFIICKSRWLRWVRHAACKIY